MASPQFEAAPLASWPERQQQIISLADAALRRGKQLYRWFQSSGYRPAEPPGFSLGQTFRPDDRFGGFFDKASIDGDVTPIMAADQLTFFDRLKPGETSPSMTPADYAKQVRIFVLRYFLTLSECRDQEETSSQSASLPPLVQPFSWYPEPSKDVRGFAFTKLGFKTRSSGQLYKFLTQYRNWPIDLEHLKGDVAWMLFKTKLLHTTANLSPFGASGPQIQLPLPEESYLVMDDSLLIDQDNPEPGVIGRYGCAYAMIHWRRGTWPFVYGPGQFDAGLQMNLFDVLDSGHCRVRQTFIVNRPRQVLSFFGFDPLMAFIESSNLLTLGMAASRLGISKDTICRLILFEHSVMIYNTLIGTLSAFRREDWVQLERDGQVPAELRVGGIEKGVAAAAR